MPLQPGVPGKSGSWPTSLIPAEPALLAPAALSSLPALEVEVEVEVEVLPPLEPSPLLVLELVTGGAVVKPVPAVESPQATAAAIPAVASDASGRGRGTALAYLSSGDRASAERAMPMTT